MNHIMPHPAPNPERVSAVTALLDQVPAALRTQLEAAFADDLSFMFSAGLDAGQQLTMNTMRKVRRAENTAKPAAAPSRPNLRLVLGGVS